MCSEMNASKPLSLTSPAAARATSSPRIWPSSNRLENARINTREIRRLMGHATGIITFDTYNAEGLNYSVLSEVVNAIEWPKVHWD